MTPTFQPKRATLLSIVALVLLFILICGTVFWMARAVNYDALLRSHLMVQTALERHTQRPTQSASAFAFDPGNAPASFNDGAPVSAELGGALRRFSGGITFPDNVHGFVRADNVLYLLQRRLGGAVEGQPVDADFLESVGADLYLGPLSLSDGTSQRGGSVALMGPENAPLAYIIWSRPTPGSVLLRQKLLPMGILALVCASLSGLAIWRTRACAVELAIAGRYEARVARTDTLTGLPNRLDFNEYIDGLVDRLPGSLAVLFLDVNGFKRINDTIGHTGGDALIVELGTRLNDLLSETDFIARIGGDEFVVVVDRADAERRVRDLGILIRERMDIPFNLQGHPFKVSVAQGYAVWSSGHSAVTELVQQADLAMYHGKQHRIASPVVYDNKIETNRREGKLIEDALRHALSRGGEFSVRYQPIVDAQTGKMVKAEALARWTSEIIGRVPPEKFIAVAEKSGLIIDVGQQIFNLICDDLIRTPRLCVSINFSPLQLQAPTFIPEVIDAFYSRNIATERIEIELTESVIVDDPELSAFRLDLLNEAGFSTALDDFGTGYSSLGYLRQMPFQTLKIDSSFVTRLEKDDPNRDLIRAITVLGHSLGQSVIAEGVETPNQANVLREIGCDLMQGYLYDRPLELNVLVDRWIDGNMATSGAAKAGKSG